MARGQVRVEPEGKGRLEFLLALGRSIGQLARAARVASTMEPDRQTQIRQRNARNFNMYLMRLSAYRAGFCPQPKDSPLAMCAACGVDFRTTMMIVAYNRLQRRVMAIM